MKLKAPFPWFGGKSRVADEVWCRFGNPSNYCEPFFGSGAVLLGRPHAPGVETVNDKDCMLANFWRAIQQAPAEVAQFADWPVNEADLHARHLWLCSQEEFRERMKTDPDYFDPQIAGWWVWGQCIWIGSGWCSRQLPHLGNAGRGVKRQLPHLGNAGQGVNRQLPHLGNAGQGVRKRPALGGHRSGVGVISERSADLLAYFSQLAQRLRKVRVCCGDWTRVMGPTPTLKLGVCGVFLDPPYSADRAEDLYSSDDLEIAKQVAGWALENGEDPRLRIALCGYEGEHSMPDTWECVPWKNRGGYGSQSNGDGRDNAARERIWFSPHCLKSPTLYRFNDLIPFQPQSANGETDTL